MEMQEKILTHLSAYGKENKYRLARALKIDVNEVTEALDVLEKEGKIEIKEGNAMLAKGQEQITQQEVEDIEEQPEEKPKEQAEVSKTQTEVAEEKYEPVIEEVEERIKGTVKFYNQNKGFGFIRGDDGQEYRVHESGIKEGIKIKGDDRVSFTIVIGYKGPEAVEVEKISESAGVQYA